MSTDFKNLVGMEGVEPPRLSAVDFESTTSAIPSHTHYKFGGPNGLRTRNLSVINWLLCSIELQDQQSGSGCGSRTHYLTGYEPGMIFRFTHPQIVLLKN